MSSLLAAHHRGGARGGGGRSVAISAVLQELEIPTFGIRQLVGTVTSLPPTGGLVCTARSGGITWQIPENSLLLVA